MSFASVLLLALVAVLVVYDWAQLRGKNRRALVFEIVAFVVGAFFIAFPDRATTLAHLVGIGRGVDFLLYPIVIWLLRESMLTRRRRLLDEERLTRLARAVAILEARGSSGAPVATGPAPGSLPAPLPPRPRSDADDGSSPPTAG